MGDMLIPVSNILILLLVFTDGSKQKFRFCEPRRHRRLDTQLPDYHVGAFYASQRWMEG